MADADPIQRLNATLEGRYRIERELGAGGMATVYLAEDVRHHRSVALKVLKPELAAVVGSQRFLAEIETTANLQHPHILPLFDSGEADGFLFYVMPYVEGESLRERLDREHQLPVDEAVSIASDVASALDYAHSHGVIHRDIKPANILLSETGEPLVSDFGIALAVSSGGGGRLTETGLSLGTPHYMSPEQATGDLNVGPQTDVYALGCVLYEMLVGEPPYTGSTPQAVLGKIITADAPTASEERKSVPPNVEATIAKALEKVPADRFSAAADFAGALGDPRFRCSPTSVESADEITEPWNRLNSTLAVLAVAGLAFGLWSFLRADGSTDLSETRPTGPSRFSIVLPDSAPLALVGSNPTGGERRGMAMAPGGRFFVYPVELPDGTTEIWRRDFDGIESTPVPGSTGGHSPFVSPDEEWIGFFAEGELRKVRSRGGEPISLADAPYPGRATWWGEDRILFGWAQGARISWVSADARGEAEPVSLSPVIPNYRSFFVVPGTDLLVYSVDGNVVVRDILVDSRGVRLADSVHVVVEDGDSPTLLGSTLLAFARDSRIGLVRLETETLSPISQPVFVQSAVRRNNQGAHYIVSAEGTLVYVPENDPPGASSGAIPGWISRTGEFRALPLAPRTWGQLSISPAGDHWATSIAGATWDVWIFGHGGGGARQLTYEGSNRYATWSGDGRTLYFYSNRDAESALYQVAFDGSSPPRRLLSFPAPSLRVSAAGPGGRFLFAAGISTDRDLFLFDPSSDPQVTEFVADEEVGEMHGRFSPGGDWVAYTQDRSGVFNVWARSTDGSLGPFQVSSGGGEEPIWSPDGRELFFRNGRQLMVSTVTDSGGTLRFGRPRELLSISGWINVGGYSYDIAPESDRFLILREVRSETVTELRVVQGWLRQVLDGH